MKAVIFNSFGKADVLETVETADPIVQADEILVRIRAAAVNPKDIFIRKGFFKQYTGTRFPMQTGFDLAGEVEAVGSQVQGFEAGASVYGMLGGWAGRTCAQYIAVQSQHLSRKPENLSFSEAAALPLVSLTVLQALRDLAGLRAGSRVCINGASGGVGTMAVQIARHLGASVTAIGSQAHHTLLYTLGAQDCVDYHDTDITQTGETFDIFFDVFGNQLFETVQPILSSEGTWVSTVLRPEVAAAVAQTKDAVGQKARQVFVQPNGEDLALVRQWVESGYIRPVIQEVFGMERIGDAHRQQETKHTRGKLVVTIP